MQKETSQDSNGEDLNSSTPRNEGPQDATKNGTDKASGSSHAVRSKAYATVIQVLVIVCVGVLVFTGVAYVLGQRYVDSQVEELAASRGAVPVVVLDSTTLAMIRLQDVQETATSSDEAADQATRFASELGRILKEYEEAGIIVVNRSVVLSAPADRDVTSLVAQRLGIDLSKARK